MQLITRCVMIVVASVILIFVAGCGVIHAAGEWTDSKRERFRNEACVNNFGVPANSKDCSCLLHATISAYPNHDEFIKAPEPSSLYLNSLRACGFTLLLGSRD